MAEQGDGKAEQGKLPGTYMQFVRRFPELAKAHEDVASAVEGLGPRIGGT